MDLMWLNQILWKIVWSWKNERKKIHRYQVNHKSRGWSLSTISWIQKKNGDKIEHGSLAVGDEIWYWFIK